MSEQPNLTGPERELESALRTLRPTQNRALDPLAISFEAGQRSAARSTRIWKLTCLAACVFASLAVIYSNIDQDRRAIPLAHSQIVASHVEPLSDFSALRMRTIALERGLDALPRSLAEPASPMRVGDESKI